MSFRKLAAAGEAEARMNLPEVVIPMLIFPGFPFVFP